jgi:hydrogenase small subunit
MKLLWLSALTCHGNVHSFLNYPQIEKFLTDFSFIYHPTLDSQYSLEDIFTQNIDCDILLLDGTLEEGMKRFDNEFETVLKAYATKVHKIITVGSCASFGGVFLDKGRYGFLYHQEQRHGRFSEFEDKTITLSGCPIQPETLINTLYMIKRDYPLHLDKLLRPQEYYGYTIHNGCLRNEYFEYKIDAYNYGELEGCIFYDHGCQAPYTHGSCNKTLWNETNSKTRSGSPCFGCTQPSFPKHNLFYTKKNMGIPQYLPVGVPKRAYLSLAGVAKAFKIERFSQKIVED